MRILAVDTSTPLLSLAVLAAGEVRCCLLQRVTTTHSEHLLTAVDTVLELGETTLEEIELLAVGRGPGAFSGIRVGIATVAGLALARGLPVLPFVVFDLIAAQFSCWRGPVCALLDARRGQVYAARYRCDGRGGWARRGAFELGDPAVLARECAAAGEPVLFAGPGAVVHRAALAAAAGEDAAFAGPAAGRPHLEGVRELAAAGAAELVYPAAGGVIEPLYIRPPDAAVRRPGVGGGGAGPQTAAGGDVRGTPSAPPAADGKRP
ncbi:MAG: tRNA (adenosine(37)-N6)-threonylcarbamoyltransferase complex dimerization subunit type 1 TsaB [Deltaproteobacteria bacterium]|nr:tRNA (adenosine(37)-N6)-threonylcarbamoyltransferase complex dimerization subunit type 1 TsaB [Candidatus Anaeroferrophillacea bacterium]